MEHPRAVIGHGSRRLTLARHEVGQSDYDVSRRAVWSLEAELIADGLAARTTFYLGPESVEKPLDDFFAALERDWRGWDGQRQWEGMEGGLALSCTHKDWAMQLVIKGRRALQREDAGQTSVRFSTLSPVLQSRGKLANLQGLGDARALGWRGCCPRRAPATKVAFGQ